MTSPGSVFEEMKSLQAPSYRDRIARLKALKSALGQQSNELIKAIQEDFPRPTEELLLTDVLMIQDALAHTIRNLKSWMKPQRVPTPINLLGTKSRIEYRPKGVVLVISPWNYPLMLTLGPMIEAWAAGNRVIIKPSEALPRFCASLDAFLRSIFPPNEVSVFQGDASVAQELISLPPDHLLFTGSCGVGKKVAQSAAQSGVPVTLELGGKCPVFIDEDYPIAKAARCIAWGKLINAGQSCIAPDYILCPKSRLTELANALSSEFKARWTEGSRGPVVHRGAFDRLRATYEDAISKGAELLHGGSFDEENLLIEPTLLTSVHGQMQIEQEEIFGPLLPIIPYRSLEEAIELCQTKPDPLALYIYSKDGDFKQVVMNRIKAGGVTINDQALHVANPQLPFGGTGASGQGAYHGKHGFLTFSHAQAVTERTKPGIVRFLYPPYSTVKQRLINLLLKFT